VPVQPDLFIPFTNNVARHSIFPRKKKTNSKKTTIQPGKPGGGLAETHFVTLAYCFVIVWVIIWDPSWNLESNDSESLCFWKILVLSWAKLEAAVENEKP
jgi:hypothetical protein